MKLRFLLALYIVLGCQLVAQTQYKVEPQTTVIQSFPDKGKGSELRNQCNVILGLTKAGRFDEALKASA